jgi:prepilin-type processing-associated H-X9-DG protein
MDAVIPTWLSGFSGDWGPLEWLLFAVPFLLPLSGIRLLIEAGKRVSGEPTRSRRVLRWSLLLLAAPAFYCAIAVFLAGCLKPYFAARAVARKSECLGRMRQLSAAVLMYAADWNETLPPGRQWSDLAARDLPPEALKTAFRCPSARSPYGYALNRRVGGLSLARVDAPAETVMLLESDAIKDNPLGGPESVPAPGRHNGAGNFGFLDGSVRWRNEYSAARLRWKPGPSPAAAGGASTR